MKTNMPVTASRSPEEIIGAVQEQISQLQGKWIDFETLPHISLRDRVAIHINRVSVLTEELKAALNTLRYEASIRSKQ